MPGKTSGFAALTHRSSACHCDSLLCSSVRTGMQDSTINPERSLIYCENILLPYEGQALIHSLCKKICHEKSTVVKVAKVIKAKTFNQGLLKRFCQEVGATMRFFAAHKFTGLQKTNSTARILTALNWIKYKFV